MALPAQGQEGISAIHQVSVHGRVWVDDGKKRGWGGAWWVLMLVVRVHVILQVDHKEHFLVLLHVAHQLEE